MTSAIKSTASSTDVVGKNIRKYRMLRCLTQEQLSEMANISLKYIQAIEGGDEIPSIDLFLRVADILQVRPGLLLSPDTFEEISEYYTPSAASTHNLCCINDILISILSYYRATPDISTLGKRVADIRVSSHMSRKELSQRAEVSQVQLGNIESDRQQTTLKTLCKIQSQFDVPMEYFIQDGSLSSAHYMLHKTISEAKNTLPPNKYSLLKEIMERLFLLME